MELMLCWKLFVFVTIAVCSLANGAPSDLQCSDSNLNIKGGTFTLSDTYNEGSILKYRCLEGYYPSPDKRRKCSRGKWVPAPTKRSQECKKITCPDPNVMVNGAVDPYQPIYYVNDTTSYTCHSDYSFQGSSTRVCQLNGKWSGSTPICSRNSDHCPDPGIPPGASRTGHIFNIDDKVTYSCDNKLKLLGSKVRVCQDGGQWSGQEPECYADFTYDTPEEVAQAFGGTLKTTLTTYEEQGQHERLVRLDQKGKLSIYIALDASNSINEEDFKKAKEIITKLMDKISYYEVSPKYDILIFATDVTKIVNITDYNSEDENTLHDTVSRLANFEYDAKGDKSGTNIAKAFQVILESMSFEKVVNKTRFKETQHVIIMFTDGLSNMGGNPAHKVKEIKQTVYDGQEADREQYLDLYVFGVGDEAEDVRELVDDWVTKRANEKHFFLLRDIEQVQKTLDEMIDESTSVGLCGLYKDHGDDTGRQAYPWFTKFTVVREEVKPSNCLGSLVTPSFILTAAHCFKFGDTPDKISFETPKDLVADELLLHPEYKPKSKESEGVSEYHENDVALIHLKEPLDLDANVRPICIPCTKETSGALRLTNSDVTCQNHKEELLSNEYENAFFMSAKKKQNNGKHFFPKIEVQIKLKDKTNECIEEVKKVLKISDDIAKQLVTDNFLCTGGQGLNQLDEVSCKGDSGGATFVQQTYRAIQVGVVSWGLKDLCKGSVDLNELATARDFHTDLFNPKVQDFLKKYLGDETKGMPLHFL